MSAPRGPRTAEEWAEEIDDESDFADRICILHAAMAQARAEGAAEEREAVAVVTEGCQQTFREAIELAAGGPGETAWKRGLGLARTIANRIRARGKP